MEQILPIFGELDDFSDLVFEINQRLEIIQRQFDDFRGVDGAIVELSGIDHGELSGLTDDDHSIYHTDARGDVRYYTETELNAGQLNNLYYTETEINAWRNSVTQTEMGYVHGIGSDIQTQLDARCLESVFGTSINAGLLLDGTALKVSAVLQKYHAIDPAANVQSLLGAVDYAAMLALLSGEAGADFAMNTHKITGVVDPVANQDAATKKYVDDNAGGTVDVVSNVATDRILGRITAGSGDSEELTPAEVMAILSGEAGAAFDLNSQNLISVGKVGIGLASPGYPLDIDDGAVTVVIGADGGSSGRTNVTVKSSHIGGFHYTNIEQPVGLMHYLSGVDYSNVYIGGGSDLVNAATKIAFWTASGVDTLIGTSRLEIDSSGNVDIQVHNASTVGLKLGGTLVDALATDINLIKKSGRAQGDILYASAANILAWLPKGTDNYILKMNGNVPNWEAESGGDVTITMLSPMAVNAATFRHYINSEDSLCDGIYLSNRNSFDAQEYYAPLTFPDGVTISKVTLYGYRDDAGATMSLYMYRAARTGGATSLMAGTITANWTDGNGSLYDDSIDNAVVDNDTYSYYLRLSLNPNDSVFDVQLYQVIIEFS